MARLKAYYYIHNDSVGRFIIKVISLHDIMDVFENTEEDLFYTDYFHPNNKGYEFIAQEVYGELAGSTFNN